MKVVYDERFATARYAEDNAALPGRMEAAMGGLKAGPWEIVAPSPATIRQLLRAHDEAWIETVEADVPRFVMASLAAGAAVTAARLAMEGEPAFACIRPPGHHAARSRAWGYCSFNNMAIALLELRTECGLERAFVIDIDQHTGDGTREILAPWTGTEVFNPFAEKTWDYLSIVEKRLSSLGGIGMLAVSAGFDAYRLDVGKKLDTADFEKIGRMVREASRRFCGGRRFAVLEGGYYLQDLGANVLAFCRGFA